MTFAEDDSERNEEANDGALPRKAETSVVPDPWVFLSQWTGARIALGRTGVSTPTRAVLDFSADHATARDVIYTDLDLSALQDGLSARHLESLIVSSSAPTRADYLSRPDLGRTLSEPSRSALRISRPAPQARLTLVIADGLSAAAAPQHALPLIDRLLPDLTSWSLDTIILATQARVALGDEIGALRGAEAILILLGERPGLRSQDSLGAYLTYKPRPGRTDAERNCVSNIRHGGLSYPEAAARILGLLTGARALQASGVCLKEDAPPTLPDIL